MRRRRPPDPLQVLPGIGPSLAADLRLLGVQEPAELVGRNPAQLYAELCRLTGLRQDPCVLHVFRNAVYVAESGDATSEKSRWWYWSRRVHPNEVVDES